MTRLFLYKTTPAQRARPDGISEAQWQRALEQAGGVNNADGLWPVAIRGIPQLTSHLQAQQQALREDSDFLSTLSSVLQSIDSAERSELHVRAERVIARHASVSRRLLKVRLSPPPGDAACLARCS